LAVDNTTDAKTLATIVSTRESDIWVAPAENLSRVQQITSGEPSLFEVQELADGRLLASGEELWIMNRDGSKRSRFMEVRNPDWIQRCGRSVVFTSDGAGKKALMRVGMDGSSPSALASGDVLSPTCSSDGRLVFYFNFSHPEKIWRISIEGGPSTEIGDVLGDTLFGPLCVSPDGRSLAYPYQRFAPPLVALAVIPAGGGTPIREFPLPGGIDGLQWSPNGSALQYLLTRDGATNLWEQPLAGGRPKQLTKFTSGQIFDFSWTADGKQLLLCRGSTTSDVVLLSNLR
jgi:Tol biopolymer transport system component